MIDHRRLQRALFVLQMDGELAARFFAGDPPARAALGLGEAELALLDATPPAGIAADPGGNRRRQILGNVASELSLSTTRAERLGAAPGLLDAFASGQREGIGGVLEDRRLPLSFVEHARSHARRAGDATLIALVELEGALVHARRNSAAIESPRAGEIARDPRAHLARLPAGTHEHASRLRAWIDADSGAAPPPPAETHETELLLLHREADPNPHRLCEVQVEELTGAVADLIELSRERPDAARRAAFASDRGASPAELEAFIDSWVEEGVLRRG